MPTVTAKDNYKLIASYFVFPISYLNPCLFSLFSYL